MVQVTFFAIVLLIYASCSFAQEPITDDGTWTTATPMPHPRSDTAAVVLGDLIYVTGGCSGDQICSSDSCYCSEISDTLQVYDPAHNSWNDSYPAMPRSRYRHGAEVLDNLLYVFGGRYLNDTLIVEVDVYNPANNSWSTLPSSSNFEDTTSDGTTLVYNKTIYVIGGYDQVYNTPGTTASFDGTHWVYNAIPQMNIPRGDICGAEIDSKVYVFGGFENNFCLPLDSLEIYDFKTGAWDVGPSMQVRGGDKACGVLSGRFHVFGGEEKSAPVNCSIFSTPSADVEEFNPTEGYWREEPPMPSPRFRFTAIYYNEAIYVIGGQAAENTTGRSYPVTSTVEVWTDLLIDSSTSTTTTATTQNGGLSSGAIVGIVIGVAIGVFLLVVVVIVLISKARRNRNHQGHAEETSRDGAVQLEQF